MTDNPLTLEWDEDGLHITFATAPLENAIAVMHGDSVLRVQGRVSMSAALELYEHVQATLGEWAREGIAARRAVADGVSLQEFAGVEPEESDIEDGIEIVLEGRYVERYLDAADHERKARRENG